MFYFTTTTMDLYYKRRLLALANNRLDHFVALRFTVLGTGADKISPEDVFTTDDQHIFKVKSKDKKDHLWTVGLIVGTCIHAQKVSMVSLAPISCHLR